MRVQAIRGANLASLRGPFALELEAAPLRHAGLFAIHGPVGAGKSTLLDALCLALFARTPRLSNRGGAPLQMGEDALRSQDPRTLLRRGAAAGHAEVDFVGVDGRSYRARWSVRRSRNLAFGRVQGDEHSLIDLVTQQRLGETTSHTRGLIARLVGLSFEEFCRSVLLAQGGFLSFMQASAGERADVLERLTGTDIYSRLSQAAHAHHKQLHEALVDSEARARVDAPLSDDDRVLVQQRLQHAQAVRDAALLAESTALQQHHQATAHQEQHRRWQRQQAQRQQVEQQLAQATAQRDAANAQRNIAEQQQSASMDALATWRMLEANLAHAQSAAQQAAVDVDALQHAHEQAQRAKAAAAHDVTQVQQQRADAKQWQAEGASWLAAVDAWSEADVRAEGARALLRAASLRMEEAERAHQTLLAAVPDAVDESAAANRLAALLHLQQQKLQERMMMLSNELAREQTALQKTAQRRALHEERARLRVDEPCPLCGQVVGHASQHAFPQDDNDEFERMGKRINEGAAELQRLQAVHARAAGMLAQLDVRVHAQRDRSDASDAGEDAMNVALDALPSMVGDAQQALMNAVRWRAHQQAIADAGATAERAQQEHIFATREQEHAMAMWLTTEQAVRGHALWPGDAVSDDVGVLLRQLRSQARTRATQSVDMGALELRLVHAQQRLAAQETHAAQAHDAWLRGQERAALFAQRKTEAQQHAQALQAWRSAHAPAGVSSSHAWEETLRARVEHAQRAWLQADAQSQALSGELARMEPIEEPTQPHNFAELEHALQQARVQRSTAEQQLARANEAVEEDDRRRARSQNDHERTQQLRSQVAIASSLAELIGSADGSKFRLYAQGLTLDVLLRRANEQLAVFAPRYQLRRVPPSMHAKFDLDLLILDRDAGDEARSAATLSGGETFLVSLALALALSTMSQRQGGLAQSLFIDEGFGSLDADALEGALAALEALRTDGRQIAVISHVPGVADRMAAVVRVQPVGNGASIVVVEGASQ
jgi:DNA repair protein SbcC/Rad50